MTEQNIIGKGTWIDKLAYELVEREKQLDRNTDLIMVESGLGASGVPHIGSSTSETRHMMAEITVKNLILGLSNKKLVYSV